MDYTSTILKAGNLYNVMLSLPDGTTWSQSFLYADRDSVERIVQNTIESHRKHGGQPVGFFLCELRRRGPGYVA